jgi:GntR family transcriptional regulator, transcriptional repressor for pyruvate dehydrogenase complex
LEQVVKTNLPETIARLIVSRIAKGEYKPGQKLPPEKELMYLFAVGRSTIREAFQALALMGLIDIRPGQGTFIRDIKKETVIQPSLFLPLVDPETTAELLEARVAVEPVVAELAAVRRTENDLSGMSKILNECEEALQSGEPVYSLSAGFHLLLARASRNTVFVRFLESIINLMAARGAKIEEYQAFTLWELNSHREILGMVEEQNPSGAKETMLEHLTRSADYYLQISSKD